MAVPAVGTTTRYSCIATRTIVQPQDLQYSATQQSLQQSSTATFLHVALRCCRCSVQALLCPCGVISQNTPTMSKFTRSNPHPHAGRGSGDTEFHSQSSSQWQAGRQSGWLAGSPPSTIPSSPTTTSLPAATGESNDASTSATSRRRINAITSHAAPGSIKVATRIHMLGLRLAVVLVSLL